MTECVFCKIVNKEVPASVVYEDEELLAFKDINPLDKVHLLIIPKEHIESLLTCNPSNKNILAKMLLLAPKLASKYGLKGFRTMINSGKEGGQEVFHIHFHMYGGSENLAKVIFLLNFHFHHTCENEYGILLVRLLFLNLSSF